jgi:hypothetical protein
MRFVKALFIYVFIIYRFVAIAIAAEAAAVVAAGIAAAIAAVIAVAVYGFNASGSDDSRVGIYKNSAPNQWLITQ